MTWWFLARSTGMVALIAFTLSVVLGARSADSALPRADRATSSAALERALDRRILRQLAHRSAAVVALAALALHVVLILFDSFAKVSLTATVIPFTAGYAPFAVGLGTLAVYVFVAVALSGWARGRLAATPGSAALWRRIHVLAYGGWALAMAHGILAGSDTGTLWSTAIYVVCGLAVPIALWTRLGRADGHGDDTLTRARSRSLTTTGGRS